MRQVFRSLGDGTTEVVDVPAPRARPGHVLIANQASILSAGTERMLVEFGRANLLEKARQQPDRVKDVLRKAQMDGVGPTLEAVRAKLDQPIPVGYASAGLVVEVGAGVADLSPGDRVASNGPHAELVIVPHTLVARIPDGDEGPVPFEHAAFASLGAVALQGMRLANPVLGETVVVVGLGVIGLLAVQLLRAQGCAVIGIDPSPSRSAVARQFGAAVPDASGDVLAAVEALTGDRGADAVLVTASTRSAEPVRQAARMCRPRGRIVLVGVTGIELERSVFYEKELSFQVSRSYGPGRYDPGYESGHDYPPGYVRWTAGRNLEAFLGQLAADRLDVAPLISRRFSIAEAPRAYAALTEDNSALSIALTYPARTEGPVEATRTIVLPTGLRRRRCDGDVRIGVIGAGNFARRTLLPALNDAGVQLVAVASETGSSAALLARKFGFLRATTEVAALLEADDIDAVVIATRHDTHADLTVLALAAGKHVYVEKPLALTDVDLDRIEACIAQLDEVPVLQVGFNRRFSRMALEARRIIAAVGEPIFVSALVNAGPLPPDHWIQDPKLGGGRIIGEACHFIDLARYLIGRPIIGADSSYLGTRTHDTAALSIRFEGGSMATIQYTANGSPRFPKERIEAFSGGHIVAIDNFRTLRHYSPRGTERRRSRRQDKGHRASLTAFVAAIRGGVEPVPHPELLEVSRWSIELARSALGR